MIDDANGVNALGGASHQPALVACVMATTKPVMEIGMGHSSTPILHAICCPYRRRLVSVESNPEWRQWFSAWQTNGHEIVKETAENLKILAQEDWGVILIDNWPCAARSAALSALKDQANYIIIHDAQNEEIMRPLYPLLTGTHSYMYKTYHPWTLVISRSGVFPNIP
jgi:hypothetical protein